MRRVSLLFSSVLLSMNCSPALAIEPDHEVGYEIADKMQVRYEFLARDCGENSPAYECSGIVIHGESNDSEVEPWDPAEDGSMSFSYLRNDLISPIYGSFDYGIILIPSKEIGDDTFTPQYLCAYSINGATDFREDTGCGQISGPNPETLPCQKNGIFTAEQWVTAIQEVHFNYMMCGWDLQNQWAPKEESFYEMIQAGIIYPEVKTPIENNEIVIASWFDQSLASLPIEAIFYTDRNNKNKDSYSLMNAQNLQQIYIKETNRWIPIIHLKEIDIDNSFEGAKKYSFSYIESEQS